MQKSKIIIKKKKNRRNQVNKKKEQKKISTRKSRWRIPPRKPSGELNPTSERRKPPDRSRIQHKIKVFSWIREDLSTDKRVFKHILLERETSSEKEASAEPPWQMLEQERERKMAPYRFPCRRRGDRWSSEAHCCCLAVVVDGEAPRAWRPCESPIPFSL